MNSSAIGKIVFVCVGLLAGLYVMVQVLTVGWNAVSNFYKWGLIAGVVVSFWRPRACLFLLIICAAYMDLLKRFLVVGGNVYTEDLIYIVGFPPLCAVSALAGCAVAYFLSEPKDKQLGLTLIAVIALTAILGLSALVGIGFNVGGLRIAAVSAGFVGLLFVVPFLLKNPKQFQTLVTTLILIFIPVALYAFWQNYNGLSPFEIEYLETGLSGEERILQGQDYRVFSTLNSSQNLCKVMGMMAVLSLVPFKGVNGMPGFMWFMMRRVPLAIMFMGAAYVSGARTGLVAAVLGVVLIATFSARWSTILSYVGGTAAVLALIMSADWLLENQALSSWERTLRSTTAVDSENRTFALGTLNVRLVSLSKIADGSRLYPFGAKLAGDEDAHLAYDVHDVISVFLLRIGYVPMVILLSIGAYFLFRIHRAILKLPKYTTAWWASIFALSNVVVVFVSGLSATSNLQTYPITYFLYLFPGYAIMLWRWRMKEDGVLERAAEMRLSAEEPVEGPPQVVRI